MAELQIVDDAIDEIAARLDLREPNRDALRTIVPTFRSTTTSRASSRRSRPSWTPLQASARPTYWRERWSCSPLPTACVTSSSSPPADDSGEDQGKLHAWPRQEPAWADVLPAGRHHRDNFATPAMRAAMDDPDVKLYLFTRAVADEAGVEDVGRSPQVPGRTRRGVLHTSAGVSTDLVVFADEHHTYYGPAFSTPSATSTRGCCSDLPLRRTRTRRRIRSSSATRSPQRSPTSWSRRR